MKTQAFLIINEIPLDTWDINLKHTTKATQKCFDDNKVDVLEWWGRSKDQSNLTGNQIIFF